MNSDLSRLIQTLSRAERRYFGLYCRRFVHEKDSLLYGFYQFLEAHPQADAAAQRAWMRAHSRSAQLPALRHALLEHVLEALRQMRQDATPAAWFRRNMDLMEMLFTRGETSLCRKRMQLIRRRVMAWDMPLMLLELTRWELRFHKRFPARNTEMVVQSLLQEEMQLMAQIQAESRIRVIHDQLFAQLMQRRDLTQASELLAALETPLFTGDPAVLAFEARLLRLYCLSFRHQYLGDAEGDFEVFEAMYALWQAVPERMRTEPERYLRSLRSLQDAAIRTRRLDRIPEWLPETTAVLRRIQADDVLWLSYADYIRLQYHLGTADTEALREAAGEIQERLLAAGSRLSPLVHLVLRYNLLILYFLNDNPRPALRLLQDILNLPPQDSRRDIQHFAPLLRLLLHVQLGNPETVETLLEQESRRQTTLPAEDAASLLLPALREWVQDPAGPRARPWTQLEQQLKALPPAAQQQTGYTEIYTWVLAQAQGIPMAQAYRLAIRSSD